MISDIGTFNQVLRSALAPITMISAVGLMMICMTARYIHATNRLRLMVAQRNTQNVIDVDMEREINMIYHRALILRWGTMTAAISGIGAALLVVHSVIENFLGITFPVVSTGLLTLAVSMLVASSLLYSYELSIAIDALSIAVRHARASRRQKEREAALKAMQKPHPTIEEIGQHD